MNTEFFYMVKITLSQSLSHLNRRHFITIKKFEKFIVTKLFGLPPSFQRVD